MDTIKDGIKRIQSAFLTKFYPWFKEMTWIMIKSYFAITIFFAITLFTTKEEIPLDAVALIGVYWGYVIAITYWLLKQEMLSEKWTNALHFLIWFIVSMFSGINISIGGFFPPLINFMLIDYWVIRGIQIYIARKTVEKEFNTDFVTVKNRWEKGMIDNDEQYNLFKML